MPEHKVVFVQSLKVVPIILPVYDFADEFASIFEDEFYVFAAILCTISLLILMFLLLIRTN